VDALQHRNGDIRASTLEWWWWWSRGAGLNWSWWKWWCWSRRGWSWRRSGCWGSRSRGSSWRWTLKSSSPFLAGPWKFNHGIIQVPEVLLYVCQINGRAEGLEGQRILLGPRRVRKWGLESRASRSWTGPSEKFGVKWGSPRPCPSSSQVHKLTSPNPCSDQRYEKWGRG